MGLMDGKKVLIMGVANKRSIAWAIAQSLHREGAQLAFTYQGERFGKNLQELTSELVPDAPLLPCDVTRDEEIARPFPSWRRNGESCMGWYTAWLLPKQRIWKGSLCKPPAKGFCWLMKSARTH